MRRKHHSDMTAAEFRAIRAQLGMGTAQLAEALLVTQRHIQMIEAKRVPITERMGRDLQRLLKDNAECHA